MEYPPLTPIEEYPLHPRGVYSDGSVWACAHPERPRDDLTTYDWRCEGCVLAAAVHLTADGDCLVMWTPTGGAEPIEKSLSWMIARSRWWLT